MERPLNDNMTQYGEEGRAFLAKKNTEAEKQPEPKLVEGKYVKQ